MKFLSIFVITIVLFLTLFSAVNQPELHKPFVLTAPDFQLESLSQRPLELQSVPMFRIGEAPVKVVQTPKIQKVESQDAPIIPSNMNIIPSDFIQTVPINNGDSNKYNPQPVNQNKPNNSDDVLKQVDKMLNSEIDLPSAESPKEKDISSNEDTSSGCTLCDTLLDPKSRSELIAWNKWRSDVQNRIMETSYVEAPYGTLFFFSFKVDKDRKISNIKIMSTRPGRSADVKNIRAAIVALEGDKILQFPKKSNRKSINFSGGFLMSDYEQFSSPEDFRDFEYIQTTY